MNNNSNNNMNRQYHIGWRFRDRGRRLSLPLQRRIVTTIVTLSGRFPIAVECLLHNGLEGVNTQIIPVTTGSGVKVLVIKEDFCLLFRLQDLHPHVQQLVSSG